MDIEEKRLIKLLKKAPDAGMIQVMDMHGKAVLSICRHILREENLAQDAAQETFIKLWKYVSDGKVITTSLRAFIHQIARNTSLNMLKKAGRDFSLSIDTEEGVFVENLVAQSGADIEKDWIRQECYRLVREVLKEMEEPDHTIFVLKYFYNFTIREIADVMQMNEAMVQSRERRGREKLKKALAERGVFDYE
ncbi:MAG: RNA polymerase sigma factor [Lachnospiraceae bacterium]|nr:RNA polymerase sigma factor [Lachnospiraceae bacterium]